MMSLEKYINDSNVVNIIKDYIKEFPCKKEIEIPRVMDVKYKVLILDTPIYSVFTFKNIKLIEDFKSRYGRSVISDLSMRHSYKKLSQQYSYCYKCSLESSEEIWHYFELCDYCHLCDKKCLCEEGRIGIG